MLILSGATVASAVTSAVLGKYAYIKKSHIVASFVKLLSNFDCCL